MLTRTTTARCSTRTFPITLTTKKARTRLISTNLIDQWRKMLRQACHQMKSVSYVQTLEICTMSQSWMRTLSFIKHQFFPKSSHALTWQLKWEGKWQLMRRLWLDRCKKASLSALFAVNQRSMMIGIKLSNLNATMLSVAIAVSGVSKRLCRLAFSKMLGRSCALIQYVLVLSQTN